jgi:hypothetical protein
LVRTDLPIRTPQEWVGAKTEEEKLRPQIVGLVELWGRIRELGQTAERRAEDMFIARDDEAIKEVWRLVREDEKPKVEEAVVGVGEEPGVFEEPPVAEAGSRTLGPRWLTVALAWVSGLVLVAGLILRVDWLITVGAGFAVGAFVSKSLGEAPTGSGSKALWRSIRRIDVAIAFIGGIVVVVTGFTTQYLQDATFGGWFDYLTIWTWAFALGSGVNVARRLFPLPTVG